ncbi:hypothetical protein [Frigoribacterium sp. CG_9.8]|uniref:hypothetical protein n=1 Tax=Frigoribacterium sp. CG_9.8 TaxID=2787733 RepID=UPI0018CA9A86|nr:hypothetical protein [Frigoribacterium sp. CG_9.8]MBG6106557.1 hypothetical protein [Frigoribacterium sp. CG_9.8]
MSANTGYLASLLPRVVDGLETDARKAQYLTDPVLWAKDILGVDLWWKQCEIAYAIARGTKKSIAVRAGHGVGKSFLSAVLVAWWIDIHPLGSSFVATTAPSAAQVKAILWREIRGLMAKSIERNKEYLRLQKDGKDTTGWPDHALPGYITGNDEWKTSLGVLVAQGRKPPDHKEDAFQGIHAQYVLAIGDEAVGLNEAMIDSLSNITSNDTSRRLLIANPTNPASRLGAIFSGKINDKTGEEYGASWDLHAISVLDSPNFHGGGRCVEGCERKAEHDKLPFGLGMSADALRALSGPTYVEEKRLEYGEDSPRYRSRVLGMFAYDSGNNLFTEFALGKGRDATCFVADDSRRVLAVDVARAETGDSTFCYTSESGLMYEWVEVTHEDGHVTSELGDVGVVDGMRIRFIESFRGRPFSDRVENDGNGNIVKTVGQATLVHQHALEQRVTQVRIDASGVGKGLVDALFSIDLKGAVRPYIIVEMLGSRSSPDVMVWKNDRAHQYDKLRERMEHGTIDIDPNDALLIEQLGDIIYEESLPHGAILIESKESMKKRGFKSPDAADTCSYAAALLPGIDDPINQAKRGDTYFRDPWELLNQKRNSVGSPL